MAVGQTHPVLDIVGAGTGPVREGAIQRGQHRAPVVRVDEGRPSVQRVGKIQNVVVAQHPAELMAVDHAGGGTGVVTVDVPYAGAHDAVDEVEVLADPVHLGGKDPNGGTVAVGGVHFVQPCKNGHAVLRQQLAVAVCGDEGPALRRQKALVLAVEQRPERTAGDTAEIFVFVTEVF